MVYKGIVTDIQHYCVHDGPGIRTVVFLKGCPLRCKWCSNPETQVAGYELGYNVGNCLGCGTCVKVCPKKCIELTETGVKIDRQRCTRCFKCQEACPTGALRRFGYLKSVEEVMKEVEKDRIFYEYSGGGITLSGGECLTQKEFTLELLRTSKKMGINTAIETTGHAEWEVLQEIAGFADYILYDLKHVDSERHEAMTGVSNTLIMGNLQRLVKIGFKPIIRIPVIPGYNDDRDTVSEFVRLMKNLKLDTVHLLP
ncbi:MAG: pyruvate formate lyase activating enzyme, partial [Tepidanaerobacteraceae bacterium]|nr:pyruvate formate lyase activating enzyme [Tepidanaerobacteraceae bacterium]